MKKLSFLLLFVTAQTIAQEVAITFDDLPFGYSAGYSEEQKVTAMDQLLMTLDKHGVTATMLITSSNISEENKVILDRVKEAGHQTGNHSHRHFNFNNVSAKRYMLDIDSCQILARQWFNSNYFRYPMLRRGNTSAKRDSVYAFLKKAGYIIAPVSIDNNEWIYNRDYSKAKRNGNTAEMKKIASEYLKHMQEVSLSYHSKARNLTGRDVKHVLLLHANPINCDYLDELLTWYKSAGWSFISLDEALKDPIYQSNEDLVSDHGWSQIDKLVKISKENK
ncbi:MAG: polysaccharide deacetylase family protein [Ekhidna sp.]|uniref:polysaccharide deacetylase family protein n=1 Tax=Ekhidna sp. TaxID=2608089 RepID=UPI0032ECB48E